MTRTLLDRVRGEGAVAVGLMLGNLLGYALALLAARRLGPTGFGELSAMLAVIIVLAVVPTGVQTVVAREVASGSPSRLITLDRLRLCILALVAGALALGPMLLLARALSVSPAVAVMVAFIVSPLIVLGWLQGLHQGREQFGRLALLLLLNNGGRAVGAILGVVIFSTVSAAIAGALVAALLAASIALAWRSSSLRVRRWPDRSALEAVLQGSVALLALFLCANADVVLARSVLDPTQAGLYAAGSVVTKIAFWLPQFIAVTALPRLVDPARRDVALRVSLLLVGVLTLCIVLGSWVAGDLVASVIGGDSYTEVSALLPWFACVGGLWAMTQVFLFDALARRRPHPAGRLWLGVVVLAAVVLLSRVSTVEGLVAITAVVASAVVVLYAISPSTRRGQLTEGSGQAPGR